MTGGPLNLASLVARARAKVQVKDAAKDAEAKVKAAKTADAKLTAQLELNSIREHIDWRSVALLHVTEHWTCRCGNVGEAPQGLFILQEHTRLANSRRLQRPRSESSLPSDLPRAVKIETSVVLMCQECREDSGFVNEWRPPIPPTSLAFGAKGEFTREWETLTAPSEEDEDDATDNDGA